jgi:regulator of protease activity HflC (stomatin/prohibitin superfamily)
LKKTFIAALIAISTLTSGCTFGRIDPGNVGVVVEMTGDDRGVLPKERGPGWYMYGFTTNVYEFPTFTQNYVWTDEDGEGNADVGERMFFSDVNGMQIGADIGVQYQVAPGQAAKIFQTYRKGLDEITHGVLRMSVRNALNKAASKRSVELIYGQDKAAFVDEALKYVHAEVGQTGIDVHQLYLVGAFQLPEQIKLSINSKNNATQIAQAKENELRQAQADAAKKVADAEGQAKSDIARAQGDAQSTLLRAEAQAKANRLLSESLTPMLLKKQELEVAAVKWGRWSGVQPTTVVGAGADVILDARDVAAVR